MLLPSFAGTFTEVWEATFKQAAPAPTDYSTINGAYRNGVEAVLGMDDLMSCSPSCDAKDQKYFPEQHGYPGIQKHRQTFGVAWGDYGARLCRLHAIIAPQLDDPCGWPEHARPRTCAQMATATLTAS